MSRSIYLDYNASTPLRAAVAATLAEAMGRVGNPSSVHGFGREARRCVEEARARVAALVGALPGEVVFTSGATESNALALAGFARPRRLVSALEHDSIIAAEGVEIFAAHSDGTADLDALKALLARDPRPALVCLMLANNETGVVQPVAAAVEIAHAHGALLHCDAVQAAGRLSVSRPDLGADSLSLSAHKIGGPMGCGALVLRPGLRLKALFAGGRQENGRRPGTENVPAIVGFGVAAEIAAADTTVAKALAAMRDDLEARLVSHLPGVAIHGAGAPRLPNTSCFSTPGLDAATQVMALDLAGVAVSAGAACSSGKVQTSHVLAAMGVPAQAAGSAIRVSFGWDSRPDDVDRFLAAWRALLDRRAAKTASIRAVAPGRASG